MQQLIDIYSKLSAFPGVTPQNSILVMGFGIMLLPTIVTLIVFGDGDRPQSGLVKEILGGICSTISIITLIGSPIIMCCIVDISHILSVLAYKPSMTVSGQKLKNVFVMESNAVSSDKPPMLNYTANNRVTCAL